MTARGELLTALAAALPAAQFRVGTAADTPDAIDTGKLAVRAFTKSVVPSLTIGSVMATIELWVLSGKADPGDVDDHLDAGLEAMLEALLPMRSVQFVSADRGVMNDTWHGYMFTLNLFETGA